MKIKQILFSIFLVLIFSINANAYNKIELGPEYFPQSTRGRPISLAYIYVGLPDTDPEIVGNQKTLYVQEEDGTIVGVTQPIRTSAGGIPLYDSSPVTLLVNGDYSLKILNSSETQIYYVPNQTWDIAFKPGNYYYPDYSATDQGVTGDNNTVKYYVDTIGVSEHATIVLLHNSGGNNTDYVFSTDETIPSNIEIKIEEGARFDLDIAKIVTINSPEHLICGKRQQIKTGAGIFDWTIGGTITPEWWGAKRDNGVTNSTTAIQEAATSMVGLTGTILDMGATDATHFYKITDTIALNAQTKWSIVGPGRNGSQITQYTSDKAIFDIGATNQYKSYFTISGLALSWDTWQAATDTNSYGIRFVDWTGSAGLNGGPWGSTIKDLSIVGGFRGIGQATTPGAMISVWQMTIKNIITYAMTGASIYFKSPVAVGSPNNTFENVYVSQRDITPTEPGFYVHVQSEGNMLNCAVEGSQGKAVSINSCPSFTVRDMHLESGILGDAVGNTLVEIVETNLIWEGGSITVDDIDTTTNSEIFNIYATSGNETAYKSATIQGVRTKIIGVTAGDTYFVESRNTYPDIFLQGNSQEGLTDWYDQSESDTEQCIYMRDGVYAKHQYVFDDATLTNSGTSYMRPGVGTAADMAVTLPDGDIIGTIKHIWKGGNYTYKSTLTITTHKLGADVVREFIDEGSYMTLEWDGYVWKTLEEELNNGLLILADGAIPPNGSGVHNFNSTGGNLVVTLANADTPGTYKYFRQNCDANQTTITIATHLDASPTSIVLTDANDYVLLMWSGHKWSTTRGYANGVDL